MSNLDLENRFFSIHGTKEKGCRLSLQIKVKPEKTEQLYRKAVKAVNKQISIPGFRKGHAPDQTVISRYSSYVEQEWKEMLINESYQTSLELTKIYPLNRDSIHKPTIASLSKEEGALVHLVYEFHPEVPAIDFSNISLPLIEKEPVTQEKIEEVLDQVRRSSADWEEVAGRAVEQGDYVDVSIDAIDEEPHKSIVKDRRFEVEDKRMAPWLKNLLIGMNVGEEKEGVSEVDPHADESVKKRFRPTKVRVTLHAIKKILLPEVTDAFSKKVGAASKEDLMEKIAANLEKEAEEEQYAKKMMALEDALLEKYVFDVPVSLVEREREERIKAKIQNLKSQKMPDEEIKSLEGEIEEEVSQEVDKALRLYFLNKQIIKQGNLSLSNEELSNEIAARMSHYYMGREMDKETSREVISQMATQLMQKKAKEYALTQIGKSA